MKGKRVIGLLKTRKVTPPPPHPVEAKKVLREVLSTRQLGELRRTGRFEEKTAGRIFVISNAGNVKVVYPHKNALCVAAYHRHHDPGFGLIMANCEQQILAIVSAIRADEEEFLSICGNALWWE